MQKGQCATASSLMFSIFLLYMYRIGPLHPYQEYLRNQYKSMKENEANLSKPALKTFENLQKQMIELKEYNEMLKELAANKSLSIG